MRQLDIPGGTTFTETLEPLVDSSTPQTTRDGLIPPVVDTNALSSESGLVRKRPQAELRSETWDIENYTLPTVDLLELDDAEGRVTADPAKLEEIQQILIETLGQFGIAVTAGDITKGPTLTRYEVYPAKGVRLQKIVVLERELARAARAERINILAPIPGKETVGVEILNAEQTKVTLRRLIQSQAWEATKLTSEIPLILGLDVYGKAVVADLTDMPHVLVAGMDGGGKSAWLDSVITSLLFRFTPAEFRIVMIHPRPGQMEIYNSLPHLTFPVVTDPKKALLALRWIVDETEKRYRIFAQTGVRNISGFNGRPAPEIAPEDDLVIPDRMPYIVIIIDELADLIQSIGKDLERALERIADVGAAAGVHLILSLKSPFPTFSGILKASLPARIAFKLRWDSESNWILDCKGAEYLAGSGDMLFHMPARSNLLRMQAPFVSEDEIRRVTYFVSNQCPPYFSTASSVSAQEEITDEDEELVEKCLEIIRQEKRASTSLLQRRLRLGYTRAARIVDILEQRGILGPGEGAKPREILVDLDAAV
jgi:S-DNA-T family DNA segregation ATPase FtsK/SpoIIIE